MLRGKYIFSLLFTQKQQKMDRKYKHATLGKYILLVSKDVKTPDMRWGCGAKELWHSCETMEELLAILAQRPTPLVTLHLSWRSLLLTPRTNI